MSKNKQRPPYTTPLPTVPQAPIQDNPHNNTQLWIVTHDSKKQVRPPHTEIVSDIEQWIKQNNETLFVIYLHKIDTTE